MTSDVVIVGGGPAGSAAAITLARSGRSVTIVDRSTFPRDKICGDGLTAACLRELEGLGLEPADVATWQPVSAMTIRGPEGGVEHFALPSGRGLFAAVAQRRDLDAAVLDLARKEGVTVLEGLAVTGVSQDAEGVTVEAGPELIRAAYAIAADGMWSPVRKLLGADPGANRGEWHAFRQYVSNVSGLAADQLVVFFEPDFLPGYFWCFPLPDGRANIGFGIERGRTHSTRDMKWLWPDLLSRPHVRELLGPDVTPDGPHRAWPIPARIDRAVSGVGRVLFAGDAVGACDPMSGEGIGQALLTGRLAAEVLNARWPDPGSVQAAYRLALDRHLVADHRMSIALTRLLRHRKPFRVAFRLTRSQWARANFARWLWEDYPRALLFTPRRWRRGAFGGVGAFRPR